VDVAQVRIGRLDFDGTVIRDIAGAYAGGPDGHAVRGLRTDGDFGRVHADGRIAAAPPYMLRADAFLLHDLAAVRVLASGTLEDVAADLTVLSHGAEAVGSAQLRPFAPQVVAAVTLIAEGIDPAAFDASLPRADLRATLDGAQTAAALLAGTLQARNAAPGFVADGAAPLQTLAARFRVEGETLVLEDTRASLGAAGEVTGSARLGRERGDAELAFTAIDLRGLHRTLRTTRMSGTASVGYEGDTQRVSARVSERGAVLALEATRRGDRVDVKRAEAAFGRSRAEGRGEVSLAGNQPFTASVRLIDLDPADFGDFPGARLNGEARARGRLAPQWAADVTVDLANSRYRDAALAGTFRGAVSATQVRDGELRLRLGENALRASGTYGLKGGSIAFELDAPRPGQVEPRAGGRLSARGRIEGTPRDPLLTVDVDGDKLAWNGRQWTERVRASLAGTIGAHSLTVDGRIADRPVQAAARGGWSEARWRGRVETLEVGGDYPFEIDGEMPLEAGADELAAGPGRARFAGGRLEVEFVRWREQRLASAGAFAALPALPFLRLGGVVMHEKTDLRLNGRWDVRASPALDGTVTLAYESGDLVLPTDPPVAAGVRRLEGDAKLVNDAISAQARLDSRIGSARATVSTGGVARTSALRAEGTAVIPNLKPFEGLVGTTAVVDGRVQLEFAASGTLGSPLINATLVGDGMRVDAPLYGVSLRDGEFRATLMDSVLRLERFIAVADRGRFVASGVMPLGGRDPQARLEWQAVDLALFNRPDRRLQVDGQGTLALENGRLALRGELKADSAYFEFERPPVAQLDNDIEIRGRPRPPRAEAFRSSLLDIDLTLDFGSNFRILGAGLETQLRGKLAVQTARDGSLVGRGTVTSERGSYYAFGQKLTIERGQLIFDGPIANPSLDVLAVRKGLAVEAGVEVSGTVQVPRIRLVSNPPVPDAEKLTWLTLGTGPEALTGANLALVQAAAATVMRGDSSLPLGRRVAQAVGLDDITVRGTGAAGSQVVAFGKRLSDRVYIEYEQGMVATNAIVRLSYALSRYFSASAETGRSTGGGLYYRRNFK
jgi:translocation and assembly module TamB